MAQNEVLKRIIEIEGEAREMVESARIEAEDRRVRARKRLEGAFLEEREGRIEGIKLSAKASREAAEAEFSRELEAYRKALESSPLDSEALRQALKLVLGAKTGARP
jgi:hypothetical protein